MKRTRVVLIVIALVLSGCATDRTTPQAPQETIAVDEPGPKRSKGGDRKKGAHTKRTPGGESPEEASAGVGRAGGGSDGEDRDEGDTTDGGRGTRESSAANYPAAGHYSFAQSGYEEFCDTAGNCEKEQLPARQPVNVTYQRRSESSAVVVSEQRPSRSRRSRTWTRFTRSGASITKVHVEFDYSGFVLERTYVPRPAVEVLRFPFEADARWSGRWEASTSGSYRVEVGSRRNVTVGKKKVAAYPVRTTTEFRGDFEGKSRITTYIDPRTKAVVATEGVLNVTSQFGRYTTVFDTRLRDGPKY